jgi:hypothetical protein
MTPLRGDLLAVGYRKLNPATGIVKGNTMRVSAVPAWEKAAPSLEERTPVAGLNLGTCAEQTPAS